MLALRLVRRWKVYVPVRPRAAWDKTGHVEGYVPDPLPWGERRKPRQAGWDAEDVVWPPVLPAPTRLRGRALLQEVNEQERIRLSLLKPFAVPDFRSGDLVQFHYAHSMSEGKGNLIQALCLGRARPNSLHARFDVVFRAAGNKVLMKVKQNSPFVTDFALLKPGGGRLRMKNYHWAEEGERNRFDKPVLAGKFCHRGVRKGSKRSARPVKVLLDPPKIA